MKLYYSPGACSLAPHIILNEIGQPFEIELVSTMDGSTRTEKHLKVNPKGRVPVLDTGIDIITEAPAILTYLGLTNLSANLIQNTPLALARTLEWMNWLSSIHASIIVQNWRTERLSDDTAAHESIQAKGRENLHDTCQQIDAKLNGLTWAADDNYSIVAPYLLVFYRWGTRLGEDMKAFKSWSSHAKNMEQRNAVQKTLQTENISIWQ